MLLNVIRKTIDVNNKTSQAHRENGTKATVVLHRVTSSSSSSSRSTVQPLATFSLKSPAGARITVVTFHPSMRTAKSTSQELIDTNIIRVEDAPAVEAALSALGTLALQELAAAELPKPGRASPRGMATTHVVTDNATVLTRTARPVTHSYASQNLQRRSLSAVAARRQAPYVPSPFQPHRSGSAANANTRRGRATMSAKRFASPKQSGGRYHVSLSNSGLLLSNSGVDTARPAGPLMTAASSSSRSSSHGQQYHRALSSQPRGRRSGSGGEVGSQRSQSVTTRKSVEFF